MRATQQILKNNNEENRKLYAKQRNYCVSLLTKTITNFFWKAVKPSLSEKFNARERISLSENGKIVKTEKETAEGFNYFLVIL